MNLLRPGHVIRFFLGFCFRARDTIVVFCGLVGSGFDMRVQGNRGVLLAHRLAVSRWIGLRV